MFSVRKFCTYISFLRCSRQIKTLIPNTFALSLLSTVSNTSINRINDINLFWSFFFSSHNFKIQIVNMHVIRQLITLWKRYNVSLNVSQISWNSESLVWVYKALAPECTYTHWAHSRASLSRNMSPVTTPDMSTWENKKTSGKYSDTRIYKCILSCFHLKLHITNYLLQYFKWSASHSQPIS